MFSKNKNTSEIDQEQYELIKNAENRIRQKKRLYYHFVIFLIGSVFLIIINKVLRYGENYNWFIWAITFWAFLFVLHIINVFITRKFLGKDWEQSQREKLIAKQKAKIEKIRMEVEKEFPDTEIKKEQEE
ncbi:hypothetical protein GTQ40_00210 [Flavobacteriaceae bacterium R38]|nr:hypothetical protein [Flavobacteriaceae bacterium R38]